MESNPSLVWSIVNNTCPQCRKVNIFSHSAFSSRFLEVKEHCDNCQARLIPEPGFYYGAMYFIYGLQVAIIVVVLTILNIFLPDPRWYYYAITSTLLILLTATVCARLSRSMMLHFFGGLQYKG